MKEKLMGTLEVGQYYVDFLCTKEIYAVKIPNFIECVKEHFCRLIDTRDLLDFKIFNDTSEEDIDILDDDLNPKIPCIRICIIFITRVPIKTDKRLLAFFRPPEDDKNRFRIQYEFNDFFPITFEEYCDYRN